MGLEKSWVRLRSREEKNRCLQINVTETMGIDTVIPGCLETHITVGYIVLNRTSNTVEEGRDSPRGNSRRHESGVSMFSSPTSFYQ